MLVHCLAKLQKNIQFAPVPSMKILQLQEKIISSK